MKRLLLVLGLLIALNRVVEAANDCPCPDDCWCRNPILKNFRWLMPAPVHKG
jgi:hypothetical protein